MKGDIEEMTQLRTILWRRSPALLPILEKETLSAEDKDAIRDLLTEEFAENGLDGQWEPTQYGVLVERLIDFVGSL